MIYLYIFLSLVGLIILIHLIHFLAFKRNYFPVLMYHRINDYLRDDELRYIPHKGGILDIDLMKVSKDNFYKQMAYLKKKNYKTTTTLNKAKKQIMITFDDGYQDNLEAVKILNEFNFKGIFYLVTNYIMTNKTMPLNEGDLLEENLFLSKEDLLFLLKSGHLIGAHTKSHTWLDESLTKEEVTSEVVGSKDFLEETFKIKVKSFCYPAGVYTNDVLEVVRENFEFAVATSRGRDLPLFNKDKYQIERETISRNDSMLMFKLKVFGIHRYLRKHFLFSLLRKIKHGKSN